MIADIVTSFSPSSYPRMSAEAPSRTSRYVAFLSVVFLAAIGISIKLRLAPLISRTFSWLETGMPAITFSAGTVKSDPPGPLRLQHPDVKDFALMIDTTRETPVSNAEFADKKVLAYLTARALYLDQGRGQMKIVDFSKSSADRPFTVDAAFYRELERGFDWVFYPVVLMIAFLSFALSIAVSALLYSLIGLLIASAAGATFSFGQLLRMAVHAQTAGCLLYSLDALLPVAIPFLPLISFSFSLTYFWLGIRAASSPPCAPAADA